MEHKLTGTQVSPTRLSATWQCSCGTAGRATVAFTASRPDAEQRAKTLQRNHARRAAAAS